MDGFLALVLAKEPGLGEIQAIGDWLNMLGTRVISWHNQGTLVTEEALRGTMHYHPAYAPSNRMQLSVKPLLTTAARLKTPWKLSRSNQGVRVTNFIRSADCVWTKKTLFDRSSGQQLTKCGCKSECHAWCKCFGLASTTLCSCRCEVGSHLQGQLSPFSYCNLTQTVMFITSLK